jgi:hypothetical protein
VHFQSEPRADAAVMREQFEYLMENDASECQPDCPECERLNALAIILKWPFREEREVRAAS